MCRPRSVAEDSGEDRRPLPPAAENTDGTPVDRSSRPQASQSGAWLRRSPACLSLCDSAQGSLPPQGYQRSDDRVVRVRHKYSTTRPLDTRMDGFIGGHRGEIPAVEDAATPELTEPVAPQVADQLPQDGRAVRRRHVFQ